MVYLATLIPYGLLLAVGARPDNTSLSIAVPLLLYWLGPLAMVLSRWLFQRPRFQFILPRQFVSSERTSYLIGMAFCFSALVLILVGISVNWGQLSAGRTNLYAGGLPFAFALFIYPIGVGIVELAYFSWRKRELQRGYS